MADWKERCELKGGTPTVFPSQAGPDLAGQPACRYDPGNFAAQGGVPAGNFVYLDERTSQEKLQDDSSVVNDNIDLALGDVVNARDSFVGAAQDAAASVGSGIQGILSGTLSTILLTVALGAGIYFALTRKVAS